MNTRTSVLAMTLTFTLGVVAGGVYDRWLLRPLRLGPQYELRQISTVTPPAPRCFSDGSIPCIPPCVINCEPDDNAGDGEPELKPYGHDPITQPECWWWPFGGNYCQVRT
jgi:hypothetical protein